MHIINEFMQMSQSQWSVTVSHAPVRTARLTRVTSDFSDLTYIGDEWMKRMLMMRETGEVKTRPLIGWSA